ncbi:MAG: hypothetical protein SH807_03630 [Blastochloris sp.]|nr:hypothetical protein [Blastochloris sp.]
MKLHSHTFETFTVTRFLIESKRDAYEANGHEYLASSEAQHQTKLRSRQIAASAVRYQKDQTPSGFSILETDVVKVIEILSSSLVRGTDHPCPFSLESYEDLRRIMLTKPEAFDAWEMALKGALQAAEQELNFETFVVFDLWIQKIIYFFRSGRAALDIQGHEQALAQHITERFFIFCNQSNTEEWTDEVAGTTFLMIEDFLKLFAQELPRCSDLEFKLFLTRYVNERFAVRHECSLQEWLFFFSTIEQCIFLRLQPSESYHLSNYFLGLQSMASSLSFTGSVLRQIDKLEAELPQFTEKYNITLRSFAQASLSEMLMDNFSTMPKNAPIIPWAIVHGQSIFSKISGSNLSAAKKNFGDAILKISERNWLDVLDKYIDKIVATSKWKDQRRESADWFERIIEKSHSNLSEGLDVIRNNPRFVPDLIALVDQASLASLYFNNSHNASAYLRNWFIYNIGITQLEHGWQHARTILRSVNTALTQEDSTNSLYPYCIRGLENLAPLEVWIKDCREIGLESWPNATTHSLNLQELVADPKCQRDAMWVLRRCLLSILQAGSKGAAPLTLRWIAAEIVPFAKLHRLQSYTETYKKLLEKTKSHTVLGNNQTAQTLENIIHSCDNSTLSYELWQQSVSLGENAAKAIYGQMPEYSERSGSDSLTLCARDNSMILRRVALSLRGDIDDPHEFVGFWWNNVVSLYLTTKAPRLFQIQLKELTQSVENSTGSPGGLIVCNILQPILVGGSFELDNETPTNLRFKNLQDQSILQLMSKGRKIPQNNSALRFQKWLAAISSTCISYAQKNPIMPAYADSNLNQNDLLALLQDGIGSFLIDNQLSTNSCEQAYRLYGLSYADLGQLERACVSAMFHCTEELDMADVQVWLSYLDAWACWSRQARASTWLEASYFNLAQLVAEHTHLVLPEHSKLGVSQTSVEKCTRDFSLALKQIALFWRTQDSRKATLHTQRFIIQMILPYIGYTGEIWRMMWQACNMHLDTPEDLGMKSFIHQQFRRLEDCGDKYTLLQPISKRINSGSEPIFSTEEVDEKKWRDSINLILALTALSGTDDLENKELARSVADVCALDNSTFATQLDTVMTALGEWFVALDLKEIRCSVEFLKSELNNRNIALSQWPQLTVACTKLKEVIQSNDENSVNILMAYLVVESLGLGRYSSSNWSIPLRASAIAGLSPSDREKILKNQELVERALVNLLGSRIGSQQVVEKNIRSFMNSMSSVEELQITWREISGFKSCLEFGDSCQRDAKWLSRRLSISAANQETTSKNTLTWYCNTVMPYSRDNDPSRIQLMFSRTCAEIATSYSNYDAWKTLTQNLIKDLPNLYLKVHLTGKTAEYWSHSAVDFVSRNRVAVLTNKSKCERDSLLTLRALGDFLIENDTAENSHHWWKRSVQPYLENETLSDAHAIHEQILESSKKDLTDIEYKLFQELLPKLK